MIRFPSLAVCLIALGAVAAPLHAQRDVPLQVTAVAGEGWRPLLQVGPLLDDDALVGALGSGLPLRFHLRLELWRKGLFDQLAQAQELFLAVVRDPLTLQYTVSDAGTSRPYDTLAGAEAAVRADLAATDVRPREPGRYYYLADLEVETLSLSDLEELRRWLRGEARPAVEGSGSPGRALERGLRRLLVRVIGLPTRSYEARSGTFSIE